MISWFKGCGDARANESCGNACQAYKLDSLAPGKLDQIEKEQAERVSEE